MAQFRFWWKCSQWLPLLPMIVFAISCVVTTLKSVSAHDRAKGISLFAGTAFGAFGTVFTIAINVASSRVDWVVVSTPERRSFRLRKTIGWVSVSFRIIAVCVFIALAAIYALPSINALVPCALGFVAAAATTVALGFSLAKMYGPDRGDEQRRDQVAQGQQLGGYQQPQQWGGFHSFGGQPQYGWQPPVDQQQYQHPQFQQQQQSQMPWAAPQQWGNQQYGEQSSSLLPPPAYAGAGENRSS
ncbi:uncharacterized protein B0I36DRAFT_366670 [Microdochium trichocladiopsis]|uniref:Uncharacterized protein n=1 Tax=Microdochium trichocladiopsis TaxID=1682393 RepID=A0A9P8XY81_9PEZI|nr:uncharacterized protein B0I36DRAFT_366670 [Microdochium trichocladiopsis]KAH7024755.1 hypothetical protein B0I36DRAFT_366670 [Microdochium trichocladiopsis]